MLNKDPITKAESSWLSTAFGINACLYFMMINMTQRHMKVKPLMRHMKVPPESIKKTET